jgi:hypothetical protein
MRITIDTATDTPEQIEKAIEFLRHVSGKVEPSPEVGGDAMMSMFGDSSASEPSADDEPKKEKVESLDLQPY